MVSLLVASSMLVSVLSASTAEIPCPAGPGSGQPNLFVAGDGAVYLSWVEPHAEEHQFRFSTLTDDGWSGAGTIASGPGWFVNWADVPSLVALNDGTLAAHWLVENGPDTYAYEIHVSFSHDAGATWSAPSVLHRDGTQTEHGFVTLMPWQADELVAVWLDGRKYADHLEDGVLVTATEEMTLRSARLSRDGELLEEHLLDARVCDCCPTTAAVTPDGLVVAYRDRGPTEVRDMGTVRFAGGSWTSPAIARADGWEVPGCPVNGPALASRSENVALAWFTAADNRPRVKLACSSDGGRTFGEAIVVDDGDPIGRVDVVALDSSVVVSWIEIGESETQIRMRSIGWDGTVQPSRVVSRTSPSRASGIPRMVLSGDDLIFAWVSDEEPSTIRTARVDVRAVEKASASD